MAVKIKLKRIGKTHAPQYRIVIADSRTARNGRAIEEIGIYQPLADPSIIKVDSERAQYWLSVGAQPTDSVRAILTVTGDWQKFKGLPGAEGTLRVAEPKPSKMIAYEAAVTAAANEPKTAPKPKLEKPVEQLEKAEENRAADEAAAAEATADAVAEDVAVEAAVAETAAADEVAADEAAAEAIENAAEAAADEA